MPLVPGRPPQPSLEDSIERQELIEKGERIAAYYENLDVNDPANQPTDDETKTIPPFHTQIKSEEDGEK